MEVETVLVKRKADGAECVINKADFKEAEHELAKPKKPAASDKAPVESETAGTEAGKQDTGKPEGAPAAEDEPVSRVPNRGSETAAAARSRQSTGRPVNRQR